MNLSKAILLPLALAAACTAQATEHAHVHGVARLDVAVEAHLLTLQLSTPLDNLIGFEHAPRSAAEQKQAADAVARLRSAALFRVDPAAGCKPPRVELSSAALGLGSAQPSEEEAGHADLDGSFEFECDHAEQAAWLDVGLFDFAHLQRLQVQVVTPKGQFKRELSRPSRRIVLSR